MELVYFEAIVGTRKNSEKYFSYYINAPPEVRGKVIKAVRIVDEHRVFFVPELRTTKNIIILPKVLGEQVVGKDIIVIGYLSDNYVGTSKRVTSKTYSAIAIVNLVGSGGKAKVGHIVGHIHIGDLGKLVNSDVEVDVFNGLRVITTKGTVMEENGEAIVKTNFRIEEGREVLAIIKKPLLTYVCNVNR